MAPVRAFCAQGPPPSQAAYWNRTDDLRITSQTRHVHHRPRLSPVSAQRPSRAVAGSTPVHDRSDPLLGLADHQHAGLRFCRDRCAQPPGLRRSQKALLPRCGGPGRIATGHRIAYHTKGRRNRNLRVISRHVLSVRVSGRGIPLACHSPSSAHVPSLASRPDLGRHGSTAHYFELMISVRSST
jgi:hypothetical protein